MVATVGMEKRGWLWDVFWREYKPGLVIGEMWKLKEKAK